MPVSTKPDHDVSGYIPFASSVAGGLRPPTSGANPSVRCPPRDPGCRRDNEVSDALGIGLDWMDRISCRSDAWAASGIPDSLRRTRSLPPLVAAVSVQSSPISLGTGLDWTLSDGRAPHRLREPLYSSSPSNLPRDWTGLDFLRWTRP